MSTHVPPHIPIGSLEDLNAVSPEDAARLQRTLERQKRTQHRRTNDGTLLSAAKAARTSTTPRLTTYRVTPREDTDTNNTNHLSNEDRKSLAASLRMLSIPRSLKAKRTRFINAQPAVVTARYAVDALLVNTYLNTAKVRKKIEYLITEQQEESAELAGRIARNPGILDKQWMGIGKATHYMDRPNPHELAKRLDILAGALSEARPKAASAFPLAQKWTPKEF